MRARDARLPRMQTTTRLHLSSFVTALAVALTALAVVATLATSASATVVDGSVTLAATEMERRPIAPTQRDQLGLVLYGFMALVVVAGGATLRRQLKGERPQSDGEFRWR